MYDPFDHYLHLVCYRFDKSARTHPATELWCLQDTQLFQ